LTAHFSFFPFTFYLFSGSHPCCADFRFEIGIAAAMLGTLAIRLFFGYCSLVRIFKNRWFARFTAKEGIADGELKAIVNDTLEAGQAKSDLGSGVYKARVARCRQGEIERLPDDSVL
jgi:hypothetical protein